MAQHFVAYGPHVFRNHITPSLDEGVCLGSHGKGNAGSRRTTVSDQVRKFGQAVVGRRPGGIYQIDDIPLYLKHTVTDIHGNSRLEGVTVSEVDDSCVPIEGTGKIYPCDTLILSVGLRPDNGLLKDAGIEIDPRTNGAIVNEHLMTSIPGIFSSGNVLHVHDLVDFVSLESEALAESVSRFISGTLSHDRDISVKCGSGIGHTVPQRVSSGDGFSLSLRVSSVMNDVVIKVRQGERDILQRKMRKANPAEMIRLDINSGSVLPSEDLEVLVE